MKRIFIIVEGETEERFVRRVLYNHFILKGIHLEPQQWFTNRKLGIRGGGLSFDFIENHIKKLTARYQYNPDVFISTMIDLYAFPKQGNTIYGADIEALTDGLAKADLLQNKLQDRIQYRNFIPYVQVYEFETLLLARPEALAAFYTDKTKAIASIKAEVEGLAPETINDSPQTAPSKRIIKYLPAYEKQKTTAGIATAEKIGLPYLRESCPHFNEWITKLEQIIN